MTELDDKWMHFAIQDAQEVIEKYGVKFFVDSLDRKNIIAFCDYFRKIQDENKLRAGNNRSTES